ncbi:MAG TPA: thioredoxin [Gemmatimonadota bacterium]|nr:thioredoxin [Gemmatimonadota bacterium]
MANEHVLEVTDETFGTEIEGGEGLAVVDFWAEWCGPCHAVAPAIESLAEEYAGKVKVGKLDVDTNRRVTEKFNVRSIPTILYFKDGELVETVVGVRSKGQLEALINAHA